jgi:hypothetical protein
LQLIIISWFREPRTSTAALANRKQANKTAHNSHGNESCEIYHFLDYLLLHLNLSLELEFCIIHLPHQITGADITMLHNSHPNPRHSSAPITLSLWLYPPQDAVLVIQDQIDMLAEDRGPSFLPHVTIVSGIPCQSEEQTLQMGRALQDGLRGFGEVHCHFSSTPKTSEGVWNQALYLTMDETDPFMKLCETCRVILGLELPCTFAPPAHKPHMSLFYGVTDIPEGSEVEPVKSFEASAIALWTTSPSTLASVPNWKEVSVIKLD